MPHYNAYESFKTKKSLEKKARAKEKNFSVKREETNDFIIDSSNDYGIIIEIKYNDAYVLYNDEIVIAKLRKDLNAVCNQILFPGDKVILNKIKEEYIITNRLKRTSLLARIKKDSTRRDDVGLEKPIAANIDLAIIVVAAKEPPLHPKFIDRYLMILENNKIPAIICLNKCDLKTETEDNILKVYKDLKIPIIETSVPNNIGIEELKKELNGKQAIFVGNSGVGKSSLTNAIMNDDEIKTSHVSSKSKRGRHTTTSSKYYVWNETSSIIDTPGIRSLDVSSFTPMEIEEYFKEFDNWRNQCKYKNCLHYHEPYESCMVKQGVNSGFINQERYDSYIRIIKELLDDNKFTKNK